jgi:hypothetical protein
MSKEEMEFKFGTPYPIDTIPDKYKDSKYSGSQRVMLYIPKKGSRNGMWTMGSWDDDRYATKPRPHWHTECFHRVTVIRDNQPDMWMPCPPEVES